MVSGPVRIPTISPMRTRVLKPLHAGDLRIRAWAPTREACVAEAVRALVVSFVGGVLARASTVEFDVRGDSDAELLTGALRTVIFRVRTGNEVPTATEVLPLPDGLRLRCAMVDAGAVVPVGVVPKGVSATGARCEPWPGGWWCGARVDL